MTIFLYLTVSPSIVMITGILFSDKDESVLISDPDNVGDSRARIFNNKGFSGFLLSPQETKGRDYLADLDLGKGIDDILSEIETIFFDDTSPKKTYPHAEVLISWYDRESGRTHSLVYNQGNRDKADHHIFGFKGQVEKVRKYMKATVMEISGALGGQLFLALCAYYSVQTKNLFPASIIRLNGDGSDFLQTEKRISLSNLVSAGIYYKIDKDKARQYVNDIFLKKEPDYESIAEDIGLTKKTLQTLYIPPISWLGSHFARLDKGEYGWITNGKESGPFFLDDGQSITPLKQKINPQRKY